MSVSDPAWRRLCGVTVHVTNSTLARARSGSGRRCGNCSQRWRRQGDARQIPVRKPEVAQYVKPVKRLLKHANLERIETYLRDVALNLEEAARSPEAVAMWNRDGRAKPWVHRWKQAVHEILRVLGDTDAVESGILVAAVFLMEDQEKHRFVSDRAFDFQLVRLWRSQAGVAFGAFYDHRTDKVTGYYRDLPPRVVEEIVPYVKIAYSRFASKVITSFNEVQTSLDEGFAPLANNPVTQR